MTTNPPDKPMDHYPIIASNFQSAVEAIMASVDDIAAPLAQASALITQALLADCKVVICGRGPDTAIAHLLAGNLLGYGENERPALPAIALDGDTGAQGNESALARQVSALGQEGDVLFCIASGDPEDSLKEAVRMALQRQMIVIVLSGPEADEQLAPGDRIDIRISAPAARRERVIELHTMIINTLCELIYRDLFGLTS